MDLNCLKEVIDTVLHGKEQFVTKDQFTQTEPEVEPEAKPEAEPEAKPETVQQQQQQQQLRPVGRVAGVPRIPANARLVSYGIGRGARNPYVYYQD